MAREYCLACFTCKEFIDLHKFRLVPDVCDESPLGLSGVAVTAREIEKGIGMLEPKNRTNQWIYELIPLIKQFAIKHTSHEMRLVDNCEPDYYWWPEHVGYTEWKEISTSRNFKHGFFLPRNLIDYLDITDWEQAEAYLKTSSVVMYEELELEEYKETFGKLLSAHATNLLNQNTQKL